MAAAGRRGRLFIGLPVVALLLPACALLVSGDEPATCVIAGKRYPLGAVLAGADGCNACTCTDAGFSCSSRPCALSAGTCTWNGETWRVGDTFALDRCNTCTCTDTGAVSCSDLSCPTPGCLFAGRNYQPGDTFQTGDATCVCMSDGSTDCTSATEGSTGCTYAGMLYDVGGSFTASDGQTCSCLAPGRIRCAAAAPGSCTFDGKTLAPGDAVDAGDGCNRCTCQPGGSLLCTARSCDVVEGFLQPGPQPLSVLFVVSDTQGAAPLQQGLADHLTDLQQALAASGGVYILAVTSTATRTEPTCPPKPVVEDGRIAPVDNSRPRLLLAGMPNIASNFRQNLALGTCHKEERGLEAAVKAITPPLIDNADAPGPQYPEPDDGNLGLRIAVGKMAVVVVSGGDDQSQADVAVYRNLLQAAVDPRRPDLIEVHALLGFPGGDCSGVGDRYAQVAAFLGGKVHYVCGGFGTSLSDLGADLARHDSRFLLGQTPYDRTGDGLITEGAGEIAVSVDGERLPSTSAGRILWSYDGPTNAVIFPPEDLPAVGARIEVRYLAAPAP